MKKSSGQIALSFLFILTSDNLFCFRNRNIRLKHLIADSIYLYFFLCIYIFRDEGNMPS